MVVIVACSLSLGLGDCSGSSVRSGAVAGSPYALMQMNLCLSGLGDCFARTAYPAVVGEAVARIRDVHPDAVTISEACRADVARIARRTGYRLRFTRVVYRGQPLRCVRPKGRGLFGQAVLTRSLIERSDAEDFTGQSGLERRRWLCVAARVGVDVCTAHLNTRSAVEVAGNNAQCAELAALLARRAATRTVIFGGDVNRRGSCAPDGFRTRTDRSAGQAPGLQHVYASATLRSPRAAVAPATHSDHDILLVRAHRAPR